MSTYSDTSRSWVEVDLANLLQNARTVSDAAPRAGLLPMVKANAYGLGALPVVRELETLAPWGYGVATPAEGVELRAAGITRPIIVFTPALAPDLEIMAECDLRPVLDDPGLIREWNGPFHLEVDTGMGRSGIPWRERDRLATVWAMEPEGVFHHFHSADVRADSVQQQEERLAGLIDTFGRPAMVHAQNSAGVFRSHFEYDLVRPGIFLYGGRIGAGMPEPRPVASLYSRIMSLRRVQAGDTVSYGATWTAVAPTTVGTLGIGYADGVRRSVAGRAEVVAGGRRCPVVGRVTMDMTMIDLGPAPVVGLGDPVTLIGETAGERIAVDDMAEWAGTLSYEILTGLGPRLPRVY